MTFRILIILLSTYYVSAQQQDLIGAAATANNDFSFKLLQQLSQGKSDNVFYSPFSINTALAMTYLGARGNTAQEMDRALGFNRINAVGGNNAVHIAYQQLLQRYNNPNQNFTLSAANKMYPANNFEVLPQFKSNMRQFYNAEPESLDYANQAPQAASTINNWVSQQTNGKIKDLFSPDSFNSMTRLVLVSAIYFKGTWKTKFDEAKTKKADFFVSQNQKVQVDMMEQTSEFKFLQSTQDRLKMIELPYSGGELSMFIILPDEINGVSRVVNLLDAQKFNQLRSGLSSQTVHVKLPKFKLETKYSLVDTLKQMGINDLFDARQVDTRHLATNERLAVSQIFHKAGLEISEEGTIAYGATGIQISPLAIYPVEKFHADKSFVFFIAYNNLVLFQGIYAVPKASDGNSRHTTNLPVVFTTPIPVGRETTQNPNLYFPPIRTTYKTTTYNPPRRTTTQPSRDPKFSTQLVQTPFTTDRPKQSTQPSIPLSNRYNPWKTFCKEESFWNCYRGECARLSPCFGKCWPDYKCIFRKSRQMCFLNQCCLFHESCIKN